jgi:dienelactone hydrolase
VRRQLLTAAAAVVALLATAAPASATTLPAGFGPDCPTYGDLRICSGSVPSFDGSQLDVDLTLPATGGAPHPLIVMLHGFGDNKHEWESTTDAGDGGDKYHWNSHWFAQRGYYVLTYTARGFRTKSASEPYQPDTPAGSSAQLPSGTIQLKSRTAEIHDTQWLAALVAQQFPDVETDRVAVSGGSYGGGESWTQASQAEWTFPHRLDPTLPVLSLQVAVPKYPWTDLAYSLAPNGHGGGPSHHDIYESSQTWPDVDTGGGTPASGNPLGVPKSSYITGLFALGTEKGAFDPEIDAWNTRILGTGDPYLDGDPVLQDAAHGLTELRSAYYQDEGWTAEAAAREVAVFSISGWTDDLFEPVESFREFKYLKRLDPQWPVAVRTADIGHSRAQNKPATWRWLNDDAWRFLQSQITGSHRVATTVQSEPTVCATDPGQPGDAAAQRLKAPTPESLASGLLTVSYAGGDHTLTSAGGTADPDGEGTDPVVGQPATPGEQCRTSTTNSAPGRYTGLSQPLATPATYVGLGEVDVSYAVTPALTQAQLDARVWDVPPSGPAFLVTRGTFRIDSLNGYDPATGTLRLPLYGNHWVLPAGHRIRLDLTQADTPTLRPDNQQSSISFGRPRLVLPTRDAGLVALTGTP